MQEIRQIPHLEKSSQERLLDLLVQFILQKFSEVDNKEIGRMLQLTPLEETRAVREWKREGQVAVLSRLVERKFAVPASLIVDDLDQLTNETLNELAEQILVVETASELAAWIEAHKI